MSSTKVARLPARRIDPIAISLNSPLSPGQYRIMHPMLRALALMGFGVMGLAVLACSQSEPRDPLPLDPAGLVTLGKLRLANGDDRRAIASFRTALLQDSLNSQAMAGLSLAYGVQKKVELAAVFLCRASSATYESGLASIDRGDDKGAEAAFNYALELVPRHPLALIRLGDIAGERGEQNRAIELFERAAEANPGYAESFVRLGHAHALQRDAAKATAAFERAIEVNINSAGAYMGLGDLLSGEAKWAAAEEQYEKLLLINPQSEAATAALERVREQL